ncbi:uromodulin-like [Lithobates pipiens]
MSGFPPLGNCSDSDCDPNATCGEFGGDQQCTCKVGFAGNGTYCEDIDECQDRYTNNCGFYGGGTCVNTIGSYTCKCNNGFKYKEESGCVDIDECADSALNKCLPLAACTNGYGSYACSCPSKYYELGSNSCTDPCSNHTVLNDLWRSTSNIHNYTDYFYNFDWARCDLGMYGWYRFQGEQNLRIPEYCVPLYSCGVHAPMWLNGLHPTIEEGIANLTACANWIACCRWSRPISVKMCPKGFYVYKIQSTPQCWYGYCTEDQVNTTTTTPTTALRTALPTTFTTLYTTTDIQNVTSGFTSAAHINSTFLTMETPTTGSPYTTAVTNTSCSARESNVSSANSQCFPDEECRIVNGVSGCYCTPSLNYTTVFGYAMPEDISTECGMNQITVSYSKCNIELLGFNTSSLHLKDDNCTGVFEIRDIRYITVTTLPRSGHCGTELVESSSYFTYTNVAYLSSAFSLLTSSTNISCTYPRSMKNVLWFSTSVLVSESNLSLGGASSYAVRMGIFQDSNYTILYDDPGGWIDIHVPLYVGISLEDKTPSTAVLLIKSCLLTTTSDTDTGRYNVISDYCPYLGDSSLYVEENGVSPQGRLSLDIADFAGSYSRIYIECQIILCNTTSGTCSPNCSQTNPTIMDSDMDIANLTVGPLFIKGDILSLFFFLLIIIYL